MQSMENSEKKIVYPYLPEGRTILYVPESNSFLKMAHEYALAHSSDEKIKTGSVIVKNGEIIGMGANESEYHLTQGCERKRRNISTGGGYELCEGCDPKNHSEPRAIQDAQVKGNDTTDADLYLAGHWWCCKPCWEAMILAGIRNVFLEDGSEEKYAR
mgnify:CR=1 FL=1